MFISHRTNQALFKKDINQNFTSDLFPFYTFFLQKTGGYREDHEDEKEDHQRAATDRTRGDPQEHVPAAEENDQRTDRVAYRTQIYEAGFGQY